MLRRIAFVCASALVLTTASTASAQLVGPDAFGYKAEAATYDFVPLAGDPNATPVGINTDDAEVNLDLTVITPWAGFPYYGVTYSTLRVGDNGGLLFDPVRQLTWGNSTLPSTSASSPDIAVFWEDIRAYLGDVNYLYEAATDRLIISWEEAPHYYNASGPGVHFQVHLYGSGVMEFHYADLDFGSPSYDDAISATIGIQDYTGGTHTSGNALLLGYNGAGPAVPTDLSAFSISTCPDADGDGSFDAACTGANDDCDDNNPAIFAGNLEICDGLDNDCDPATDESVDFDGDGVTVCNGDCDDTDPLNFLGNAEFCDGQDNDCDGLANDDLAGEVDADADTFLSCAECDDADPTAFPGNPELCDGIDNDCDGTVPADETTNIDGDGFVECADCDDLAATTYPDALELCDGIDQNCDTLLVNIDAPPTPSTFSTSSTLARGSRWSVSSPALLDRIEALLDAPTGSTLTWTVYEAAAVSGPWDTIAAQGTSVTTLPSGTSDWHASPDLDLQLDAGSFYAAVVNWTGVSISYEYGFTNSAPVATVFGAYEGSVIGTDLTALTNTTTEYAIRVVTGNEEDVDGDNSFACGLDCDDNDATTYGGAPELCDTLDNDCDGQVPPDESDGDSDGFLECINDCDDVDASINPAAVEVCDGVDQDCDTFIDEPFDVDGDGWFTDSNAGCLATYGSANTDCDDAEATTYPGAAETCDAVDSDCDSSLVDNFVNSDGDTDPDCIDTDDDNDGDPDTTDCADTDPAINNQATEICDAIDQDCDGDFVETFANNDGDTLPDCADPDDDNDGVGDGTDCAPFDGTIYPGAPELCDAIDSNCNNSLVDTFTDTDGDQDPDCTDPNDDNDPAPDSTDCDDTDPTIYPGAIELCDAIDQDCDGDVVESFADFDGDLDPDCSDPDDDNDGSVDGADCDDFDDTIYPGATELCDLIDQDCDTDIVETFADTDGDGTPDCVDLDVDGDGFSAAVDCDDTDATIYPLAPESCDLIDSDCRVGWQCGVEHGVHALSDAALVLESPQGETGPLVGDRIDSEGPDWRFAVGSPYWLRDGVRVGGVHVTVGPLEAGDLLGTNGVTISMEDGNGHSLFGAAVTRVYDLNRDGMIVEADETQALYSNLVQRWDPDLLVDLHTTNGTWHGYSLTYAPSYHTAGDAATSDYTSEVMLPAITQSVKDKFDLDFGWYGGYDYRNWPPTELRTFHHAPRYITNHMALRNRMAILSETFSHDRFYKRVHAANAFVEEILEFTHQHGEEIRRINREADERVSRNSIGTEKGVRFEMVPREEPMDLLTYSYIPYQKADGTQDFVRSSELVVIEDVANYNDFAATESAIVPSAYVFSSAFTGLAAKLRQHGIWVETLEADTSFNGQTFVVDEIDKQTFVQNGHRNSILRGEFHSETRVFSRGDFIVSMNDRLANLIFYLLEPESDDSLAYWNLFDDYLEPGLAAEGEIDYPVFKVLD